jgi:5,10-methylenetetrahydrofolate reductase
MELRAKLPDPAQPVLLYGTTPPRLGTPEEQVSAAAEKLAARLAPLPLDALVVYDIQDEAGRTAQPRPFPFTQTIDPCRYSALLKERTGHPAIAYKALGTLDEAAWRSWLGNARAAHDVQFLSVVGRPTSGVRYPLSLSSAIRIAAEPAFGLALGGVVIAERHTSGRSEAARLLAKGLEGCSYFISQTVYHARPTQRLLRDYLRDCRGAGVEPRRIVLTFSPCGREKTLAFLRWLGVNVAPETERSILGAANPLARSIEICRENLRSILEQPYVKDLPLGVNVESVSINRDEIDASIDLFHALREVLDERLPRN